MAYTRRKLLKLGLVSATVASVLPVALVTSRLARAQPHESGSSGHHSDHIGAGRRYHGGGSHGAGGRHLGRGLGPDRSSSHGGHTVEDKIFHHQPPDDNLSDLFHDHDNEGHEHPDGGGTPRGPMYRGG